MHRRSTVDDATHLCLRLVESPFDSDEGANHLGNDKHKLLNRKEMYVDFTVAGHQARGKYSLVQIPGMKSGCKLPCIRDIQQ
jgi:hypothetical protein